MTAEIGRVLGGRYRLVAPIGMGASAQVYLADDVKLRRRVALKMLHDALAGDAEFLRRFRAEARAAAALSHPNVMAVYDWGDGEVAFIVTEYLPGGSLRALLDGGQQLSPAQALGVGLEAARALDYAHRRGFVHRDIKPANLLFGEEQRLRIADFGLARALAEAAWTEPQGAVLGTARYSSPEQAKGETLSGKADVYALALVLVEAVTGEVPFVADTTLGTLMARVGKPLVVPDSLGPLQDVLVRAGHPDPEQRIDARTLATGLLRAAKELSRPAPLPLAGALAAGQALADDPDPTVHGPLEGDLAPAEPEAAATDLTADDLELEPPHWVNQAAALGLLGAVPDADADDGSAGGAADEVVDDGDPGPEAEPGDVEADVEAGAPGDEADGPAGPDTAEIDLTEAGSAQPAWADAPATVPEEPDRIVVLPDVATVAPAPLDPPPPVVGPAAPLGIDAPGDPDDEASDEERHRRRWPWAVLVVVLLAGTGGGIAAAVVANRDDPAPAVVRTVVLPLPELTGLTEAQATAVARASGWEVEVAKGRRDGTVPGEVLGTAPAAGTRVKAGAAIALVVSQGQDLHSVPGDLVGKTADDAIAQLESRLLKAEVGEEVFDEEVDEGVVVALAEGTPGELETGSLVQLVVSKGPAPRTVPSGLKGSTYEAAEEALSAIQLRIAKTESFSDDVAEGTIISVLPAQGDSVPRGTVVTVEVSKGPELKAIPNVARAESIQEAINILNAAGFSDGDLSGPASGEPVGSRPAAGTLARPGSTVDIVLG